jgi:hypothetical protein
MCSIHVLNFSTDFFMQMLPLHASLDRFAHVCAGLAPSTAAEQVLSPCATLPGLRQAALRASA